MGKFFQSHTSATDGGDVLNTEMVMNGGNEEM